MGLLKLKTEKTEPVSRQEFEALAAQLESFKTITALLFAAVTFAAKAGPGTPDANPIRRLELHEPVAGLEPGEQALLRSLTKKLDRMSRAESQREMDESAERTRPRTGEERRGWYPI
jgi:hypothetical protein